MTCRRRKRTLAHSHTRVRAGTIIPHSCQRADALQRGEDTTSCAIALFAWLDNTLHRANALFICRMQEVEFNIIDIIGVTYAFFAYRRQTRRFDPPLRADRAGAFANDPSTHPRPPFRYQVLT
jgi:hypothetical protein